MRHWERTPHGQVKGPTSAIHVWLLLPGRRQAHTQSYRCDRATNIAFPFGTVPLGPDINRFDRWFGWGRAIKAGKVVLTALDVRAGPWASPGVHSSGSMSACQASIWSC